MQFSLMCDMVRRFHEVLQVSPPKQLTELAPREDLEKLSVELIRISKRLEKTMQTDDDPRILRLHLATEELGEFCEKLAKCDEVGAADGWADRMYILIGDMLTFDWPGAELFAEVHTSNMTKVKSKNDPSAARVRDKGAAFIPPKIDKVLELFRKGAIKGPMINGADSIHRAIERSKLDVGDCSPEQIERLRVITKHAPELTSEQIDLICKAVLSMARDRSTCEFTEAKLLEVAANYDGSVEASETPR